MSYCESASQKFNNSNSRYQDGIVASSTNPKEPSVWVRGGLPNGVKSFQQQSSPPDNLSEHNNNNSGSSSKSSSYRSHKEHSNADKSVWMNHSYPKEGTINVRPTTASGAEGQRPQLETISDDED